MKQLNVNEIQMVNGGCAEHCWGDFDAGELASAVAGGAVSGVRGGLPGLAVGAAAGAITYLFNVMWSDD